MTRVISWLKQLVSARDYLSEESEAFLKHTAACKSVFTLDSFLNKLNVGRNIYDIKAENVYNFPTRVKDRVKDNAMARNKRETNRE